MGKILHSKGELNSAINYYRRAIQNQPNFAILYRSLGYALFQKENYSEAIINFLIALEIDSSPNTDEKLKKTYLKLGCTEKGAEGLLSRIKESSQQKTFQSRKIEIPEKFQQELSKPKVFGIGLGKTGTTTLGACLNHLNYKHYGWSSLTNYKLIYQIKLGDFDDVYRVVNQYDSFEDYPWPFIYKLLDEKYPNSKFILTIRKCSQTWFKSCLNHYLRLKERAAYVYKLIYGLDHPQDFSDEYVKFYETHNQEVIDYFKFKSDKLLIVSWEEGDSWEKLCGFLGKKVPNIPLPHLMKSKTS
ncbi:sulfotransferase [Okeania sp. SIO3B5]|uniref:sulfotransferase n=1 Tax=Okeania sp. SIO3B5 TaxID=2607811 RepID=UPI0025E150A4|nr:sulfotransferase [Okeania sp. SIO3B5]